ncbi:MAG: NAD-dependent epimerase/dehydratase family protein [Psychrilyobacter sp.]|uniref:NAD-dependent epimerase/dehydratase family protein n=1 Tax=Psychrilyobacter sp. TaxID=2586924 RepID=UPI003C715C7F
MKKVLIFGGNQFLGKHISNKLIGEEYQVYVFNRGKRKNSPKAVHLKGDRNSKKDLQKLLDKHKFEAIIDVSSYEPVQIKMSLEALRGRYKKYIFISSASVYENIEELPVRENNKIGGNLVWGDYALNKFLCEKILKEFSEENTFNFIIFRPFYIFGPENNLDREIYFFNRILDEKPIFIPSKETIIQFGYVKDLANNIFKAIENDDFNNNIFNISGNEHINFKEMINVMGEVVGKKAIIKEIDESNIKVREWFPFRTENLYGDISKLIQTGGTIKYSFKEGIEETFKYCLKHKLLGAYDIYPLEEKFIKTLIK